MKPSATPQKSNATWPTIAARTSTPAEMPAEPRDREPPPPAARVEPHDRRDDEPAAEDAEQVADERARGRAVRQHADDDEDEERDRVYSSRMVTRTNHVSIAA